MSVSHSPFSWKSITVCNHIDVSPMRQYGAENGFAVGWHPAHYGARAIGGTGLTIMEATAVETRGRIAAGAF